MPLLRDFRSEQPDIALEITSKPVGESEGDVDIAIVYSEPRVTNNILDLLWMAKVTPLCSPTVVGDAPPDLPTLIGRSDLLHVRLDERPRHHVWELFARSIGRPDLNVARGLVFDTAQLAAQYALSGAGLALVDPLLFREELASGRLVQPFPARLDNGYGYYLSTSPEDLDNEAVALFRTWLIDRFAAMAGDGALP
jgi:DNA-binding transcriptional LysR family regulator